MDKLAVEMCQLGFYCEEWVRIPLRKTHKNPFIKLPIMYVLSTYSGL
ncbi:hypothetical protein E4N90_05990 [Treponema denticola]|nr:hypothetical protein [Treponema denticola]UTD07514.1 hypothetical protein E4N90_05990 [Treponema denticola]